MNEQMKEQASNATMVDLENKQMQKVHLHLLANQSTNRCKTEDDTRARESLHDYKAAIKLGDLKNRTFVD